MVFFFVFVILSRLPLLHSAKPDNISMPTCPKSFTCPHLSPFTYPFYNVADTRCGLIKVNCTSYGGQIKIGGRSYEMDEKIDYDHKFDVLFIRNRKIESLLKYNNCEALMNNYTSPSPSPLLYTISIIPTITLFKCTKSPPYVQQVDAYFERRNYSIYNNCTDYSFYYSYGNTTIPRYLPHACQVLQLPVKSPSPDTNKIDIFSFLSSEASISFILTPSCCACHKRGGHCYAEKGKFQCAGGKEERGREWTLIKIMGIGGSALILMLSLVIFIIWRHCKNNPFTYASSKNKSSNLEDISLSCGVSFFSYKELEDATQNFDPSHELGDGGFGAVYYGKLKDGREVAVKKLHEHNYNRVQHFCNEVEILTKLRHPNLVVLYGCTSRLSHELLLVYEYVPNGTVADHLHGEQANPNLLTWPTRMNIAIETATALVYLHASEIIHRDNNFCIKVADFGLSRFISKNATHVSTAPQGTPGYVDPQYHQHYQLTDKSDVYSFGVVLIELISSMVAVDLDRSKEEISLANLALKKIQRCALDELIDPVLGSDTNPETMNMIMLVAELAFRCLQYDSDMRPAMNEVLDVLMDIQAVGRIDTNDNTIDLQSVTAQPLSGTIDAVVLLKDFSRSPVSVASEWQSASTTVSSNGD